MKGKVNVTEINTNAIAQGFETVITYEINFDDNTKVYGTLCMLNSEEHSYQNAIDAIKVRHNIELEESEDI